MAKELEKDIQLACCDYLARRNHFFWRQNTTPIYNAELQRFRSMPKYSKKGVPDIIVVHDGGYVVFLEIKREKGVLSEHQKAFQKECKEKGAEYYVITAVDQLKVLGL